MLGGAASRSRLQCFRSLLDLCVIADALATWPAYFCLLPFCLLPTLFSHSFFFFALGSHFVLGHFHFISVWLGTKGLTDSSASLHSNRPSTYPSFGPSIATGTVLRCFVPLHPQPFLTVFTLCEHLHRHLIRTQL